jgi:alpha-1,6-mannosyltransferase
MTRIAHIANMYGPKSGGLKTAMNSLSREYEELGHEVLLVVPGKKDSLSTSGHITTVTVSSPVIPFSGGYRIILNSGEVIRLVKNFDAQVLEISDRTTLLRVSRWARKRSIPTIFFAHERVDGVINAFGKFLLGKKALARFWNKYTAASVDRIVATTKFASEEFVELGMVLNESQLVNIPLGVDLELFHPSQSEKPVTVFQEVPENFVFACTRLSKEKDPLYLLDIARELKARSSDLTLVIAGSGPYEKRMKETVLQENLPVILLGFVSDKEIVSRLMAKAQVFLAVGPIETFGLAALESLASGTPVVCRKEAAISEIITSLCGAALHKDTKLWVDAIEYFSLMDLDERRLLARNRAEEFSWSNSAHQLLALHELEMSL